MPNFKGLDSFEGKWYHTARWPKEGPDLTGKRIGVIGAGSTGIQVITAMAKVAGHLYVFQRTPNYSLPSSNKPMDPEYEAEWKRRYREHRENARVSPSGVEMRTYPQRSAMDLSDEERNEFYEQVWNENAFTMAACFNDLMTNPDANASAVEFVRNKIRGIGPADQLRRRLCRRATMATATMRTTPWIRLAIHGMVG